MLVIKIDKREKIKIPNRVVKTGNVCKFYNKSSRLLEGRLLSAEKLVRGGILPVWAALFYGRTFYANCHGTDNNYAHYPFHSVEDADRECEKVTERVRERQSRVITRHLLKQA